MIFIELHGYGFPDGGKLPEHWMDRIIPLLKDAPYAQDVHLLWGSRDVRGLDRKKRMFLRVYAPEQHIDDIETRLAPLGETIDPHPTFSTGRPSIAA